MLDFSNSKILIVGDVMLDKYYFGKVDRISPEAPVPIVNIQKEESRLGGASNVANNIVSLGGHSLLCGVIGHDLFGKEIERISRHKNIDTFLLKTSSPTITKARIIGGKQQIVRVDYEDKSELNADNKKLFRDTISRILPEYDILVISDYGKGLISEDLCRYLIKLAHKYDKKVIIDPKGKNWEKYSGADIVTPNVKELSDIVGYTVPNTDRAIEKAAREAITNNHLTALLVTRSDKGMSLIGPIPPIHIPTHSEEVFDVSGAGDTVVATLGLCLAAGFEISEAMRTANIAAGIVVKKIGTATLTIEELVQQNKKSCSLSENIRFGREQDFLLTATHTDKVLMKCGISGQLRMKRSRQHILFAGSDDMSFHFTQYFYSFSCTDNIRSPDKYQRNLFIAYLRNHHLSIETIDLRTVSIPSDRDIHHSQMHNRILIQLLCQQDHACTRTPNRHPLLNFFTERFHHSGPV